MELLREMMDIRAEEQQYGELLEDYNELKGRFEQCINTATQLVEGDFHVDQTMKDMEDVSKRFEAARRGLGLVNKLQAGPSKKKHGARVLGNLNRIRGLLRRLEKQLAVDITGGFSAPNDLNVIPQNKAKAAAA